MKRFFSKLFLWSWIVTLPIALVGLYWSYSTLERFYTFSVRYNPNPHDLSLNVIGRYEFNSLVHRTRLALSEMLKEPSSLKSIWLFIPESNISTLESRMPQSSFEYTRGSIIIDGKFVKAKFKYRGDFTRHWAWGKKSIRVKTSKKQLFEGMRAFNLQTPKYIGKLNNFFSYHLAEELGLLSPRTELVRLYLNGEDRGVYILVEQLEEMTLRRNNMMPADVYRGEIIAKDKFEGSNITSLLESPAVWDKISINNHYDSQANAPLTHFLSLINQVHQNPSNTQAQEQLSAHLDMQAWGSFSAFETLAQTRHFYKDHNWRLYYDPWRQKMVPIPWDPVGWSAAIPKGKRRVSNDIMSFELQESLFSNGDFIRARNAALLEFFGTNKDKEFLSFVSKTVAQMKKEIKTDPLLKPPNPHLVIQGLDDLENNINKVFKEIREDTLINTQPIEFNYTSGKLKLAVKGRNPIQRVKINFDQSIEQPQQTSAYFNNTSGRQETDISSAVSVSDNSILIETNFLPNFEVTKKSDRPHSGRLLKKPGHYAVVLNTIDPNLSPIDILIDRGAGWEQAVEKPAFSLTPFSKLHAPVKEKPQLTPLVWTGEIIIEGVQTVERPLIINPGTTVRMAHNANLIIRGPLTALGTAQNKIRFIPYSDNQKPWGAIVLLGHGADGSTLSHCEMANGSGWKESLFEYSAMFSIHGVNNVKVSDCLFRDNSVVDDMVHAVYADIEFERTSFLNAFSDALDLDMTSARINECTFENSGNDAIDLMTTKARVSNTTLVNSGDKGISVGENSQLLATNNNIIGNNIGVQSKDFSTAILINQTIKENNVGLSTYRKNWRYETGGLIFLSKSNLSQNKVTANAEKQSKIQVFDSYIDSSLPLKRILAIANGNSTTTATENSLLPDRMLLDKKVLQVITQFDESLLHDKSLMRRGASLNQAIH